MRKAASQQPLEAALPGSYSRFFPDPSLAKPRARAKARSEYSAGGLVHRSGKVLLVKVRNLKGEIVWTFPKGHLEKGETPKQAALREVAEETGYCCRLKEPLMTVRYHFQREGKVVDKHVRWYRMEPEKKVGPHDHHEVRAVRWTTLARAAAIITYPSDKKLLALFMEDFQP